MSTYDGPLENVRIASPCSADWDAMRGDDRKRFCRECKLNVYDLSGMTRYDAENLLRLSEGRLCVRYFQRPDGTILTQDCPVGWARVKQRVSMFAATVFALVVSLFGSIFVVSMFRRNTQVMGSLAIPTPSPTPKTVPLMGVMSNKPVPTPTPKPKAEKLGRVVITEPAVLKKT